MYTDTIERFGGYIPEHSVLVRTVPELFVAEVAAIVEGEAFEFFRQSSPPPPPPFCIQVARQC